jgi:hypothetical protein
MPGRIRSLTLLVLLLQLFILPCCTKPNRSDKLAEGFISPPDSAKPRVYWWWLFNRVDSSGITRDLEEFRNKGISGVNLICTGGYAGKEPLPGVRFMGEEWRALFRHAGREAKRLNIELGFNMAGGWTMMGPWVTHDKAMKKIVFSKTEIRGPFDFSARLPQPETVENYYADIRVQAFRLENNGGRVVSGAVTDLSDKLKPDGTMEWHVPEGHWVLLRSGYTLTGHQWSRWYAYPKGDTFEGGDGYEIDYLSKTALDDHFNHLARPVIEEVKKAGGKLSYLWSDSWECGKLTWTQDFEDQFRKFRGYDLRPYLPVLAGYVIADSLVSERFNDDFNRTIQDCIAENFYGHFMDLCHKEGLRVGNEAGGPNDIPPQDVLKNLGRCDIPAGEFWVNYAAPDKYNTDPNLRLNLKQTATAAHVYGKVQSEAEAFTQMERDRTHWSMAPSDLKPYANDAFCEGINRFMLHQATCQPPSDGKPGYEFCAGQHFTPNQTWWEYSPAFFSFLSRCQFMLQQGKFAADVCYFIGDRPPALVPPKYIVPGLGPGYDCDYCNEEVLLTRMTVRDGRIVLPDGMSYRMLVLQNCTSPSPDVCRQVEHYQKLKVSSTPSKSMSVEALKKIRQLVMDGATVVGPPPELASGLKNFPECDKEIKEIAGELWKGLDGRYQTEKRIGKGRVIWGRFPAEILADDEVHRDFSFRGQDDSTSVFDYIHRTDKDAEIYYVINRTTKKMKSDFTFRVKGRQPEIWDPVSGSITNANSFSQSYGRTTVPLEFDRFGSLFIVFRKPLTSEASGKEKSNFEEMHELISIEGPWKVSFDTAWSSIKEAEFTELVSWTTSKEEAIKHYSGKAIYRKNFDISLPKEPRKDKNTTGTKIFLDLGDVRNVAEVVLNGQNLGVLWCAPWRKDVTEFIREKDNSLEIRVVNLWPNRVIGDLNLPPEKRLTKTHDVFRFDELRAATPLIESGLLGPVRVMAGSL